jgi:chromosome segregation ATPase
MADQPTPTSALRRSAVYSYLRPLLQGRRVIEVGCGNGEATAHLLRLGAKSVIGAGTAREIADARARQHAGALGFVTMGAGSIDVSGVFDLVLVPDATDILRGRGSVRLSALLPLVAPGGRLACVVPNGDRGEGLAYYDVVDTLGPHFAKVRMFGQTPFLAFGMAEFDEAATDLHVDAELAEREAEEPTHYIAVAGPDEPADLDYALVQIPAGDWECRGHGDRVPAPSGIKAPDTALTELRQKLVDSESKAEGLVRVSRAQTDEIEELRARLRRTAEARAELDEEVRRLRRSLVEADESVVTLTRKTTEELTALAQRLTSGLRSDGSGPSPALAEELQRREDALAERESALSERDDRVAALEAAKQEALWRADASDDALESARVEISRLRVERVESERASSQSEPDEELLAKLKAQEATLEDFRRAAAAHLEEVSRLRDAANEQASLVTELEEALAASEKQLAGCSAQVKQLEKSLAEMEAADLSRRSRLAELEGRMLRAERASANPPEARQQDQGELQDLQNRLSSCQGESEQLRARLRERDQQLAAATAARAVDADRLANLESKMRHAEEQERRLAELRLEAPDPEEVYERLYDLETQYQAATMAAARVPALEAKIAELENRSGKS